MTTTGVSGSPLFILDNTGSQGGGVYREGGTMTTTNSPITANIPNNCVGSSPAVPNCTG